MTQRTVQYHLVQIPTIWIFRHHFYIYIYKNTVKYCYTYKHILISASTVLGFVGSLGVLLLFGGIFLGCFVYPSPLPPPQSFNSSGLITGEWTMPSSCSVRIYPEFYMRFGFISAERSSADISMFFTAASYSWPLTNLRLMFQGLPAPLASSVEVPSLLLKFLYLLDCTGLEFAL